MAISKERKEELLAQYEKAIGDSRAVIITEYHGLTTPQLEKLRAAVRDADGSFNVVKLTLFKLALERAGLPVPEDLLQGPVAVGFCQKEVPSMAKAFKDFVKDFGRDQDLFKVRGAIMGEQLLSSADVDALAELPPLEVIRAQLIGMINGPARNVAGIVASGVRQVVNVLNAYAESENQAAGAEA